MKGTIRLITDVEAMEEAEVVGGREMRERAKRQTNMSTMQFQLVSL